MRSPATSMPSWPTLFLCLCSAITVLLATEVPRPRGVELSRAALYDPTGPKKDSFVCLDGLKTIAYTQINDDYCDCADASDEPGTAACPNGHFHCVNAGHRSLRVPSSRVNDGVCDCCDASDEYAADAAQCVNECTERGREDRVREKQRAELARLGTQLKADMVVKGRARKVEQGARLNELKRSHAEAEALVEERRAIREEAERKEADAVDVWRVANDNALRARDIADLERDSVEGRKLFAQYDLNGDGHLTLAELRTNPSFDSNRDGKVTENEALYFLVDLLGVNADRFVEVSWPRIEPVLNSEARGRYNDPKQEHSEADAAVALEQDRVFDEEYERMEKLRAARDVQPVEEVEEVEADLEHEGDDERAAEASASSVDGVEPEEEYEEEEEEEEEETGEGAVEPVQQQTQEEYDAETNQLVEEARGARDAHTESERELRGIQSEIQNLEAQLDKDFGLDEEFAALQGECFTYEDREYLYKVCPFDRAVQQSRGGGSETRLGTWKRWTGSGNNPHATMMFTSGAACWNGPQRSATVHLECGLETRLLSVAEPNRCEYVCTMQTPAACSVPDGSRPEEPASGTETHDEL